MGRTLDEVPGAGLDVSPLATDGQQRTLEEMLMRTTRVFNFPKIPIIATHSYMTLEYDENEIFVHHPHIASYYANKLDHILHRKAPPSGPDVNPR